MTPLAIKLRRQIALTGPISVADYMARCLYDPEHGYYTTRDPFGAAGDFVTAPEISQMFGEILAAWWLAARVAMQLPDLVLAEAGPGRGTLMNDMLRTMTKVGGGILPDVVMIETSARLAGIQKSVIDRFPARQVWIDSFEMLPPRPVGLVANELLDAIPVRQFVKTKAGWLERMVTARADAFEFTLSATQLDPAILPPGHDSEPDRQIFEYAPARLAMIETICRHLNTHGGFALFIDYGHAGPGFGDTLQAVRNHQMVSIFDRPGEADITSHVDFDSIARIAVQNGQHASNVMEQGAFLLGAGIGERAEQLTALTSGQRVTDIETALHRLVSSEKMGRIFKVLAISSKSTHLLPLKFWH